MDPLLFAKINNIVNEIENQLSKDSDIDSQVSRILMSTAVNRISTLLTHISYLESRIENLSAENQRLSQIAKY
jgi:archaellum component FlaC